MTLLLCLRLLLQVKVKVKVKVRTLDISPLRESSPQKRSVMAWHMFSRDLTVLPAHPHVQSAIEMSHTCLRLRSYSWYLFIDPGGMEGRVGLGCC